MSFVDMTIKALEKYDEWPYGDDDSMAVLAGNLLMVPREVFRAGTSCRYNYILFFDKQNFYDAKELKNRYTNNKVKQINKQEIFEKAMDEFDEWPSEYGCLFVGNEFNDSYFGMFDFGNYHCEELWDFVCTREEFEEAKAERSKTYWVGNGDPQVGEWVQTSTGQFEVLLPPDVDGMIIIKEEGEYFIQCLSGCKPIDTRTEKEKAIDDIVNDLPAFIRADMLDIKTALQRAYDKWLGDKK